MPDNIARMSELIEILNNASRAYYNGSHEIMNDQEYDKLYDELQLLETSTGVIRASSPTQQVGYEVVSSLPKEQHAAPMLSLNKTKSIEELSQFAGSQKILLSWKMDGLTIVLTYRDGELFKAVTRGNGEVGEVITNNARVFYNIPSKISCTGELVIRGEAVISYSEFERINEQIEDADEKYKNPRNLCSGTVRQLNNEIVSKRKVYFFAFALVKAEAGDFENSHSHQLKWLSSLGFDVVDYLEVTSWQVPKAVDTFKQKITDFDFPSDGLVAIYDDIHYGESLGRTAKFPRDSIAFKWEDEIQSTVLENIEWSASRTGLINPIAVFQPVELEGSTVSRAFLHNVSTLKSLKLGIGDTIEVYKANMIIPQIASNLTMSGNASIPEHCPVCQGKTVISNANDKEFLYCENPQCAAKKLKGFEHFVKRDAINIEGLSEQSLEKFINRGFLKDFANLFTLEQYRDEISAMEGFGEKSCDNLFGSITKSRDTTLTRFLYSLGISGVGLSMAKMICRVFNNDLDKIINASVDDLCAVDGIGPVVASNLRAYMDDAANIEQIEKLCEYLNFADNGSGEQSNALAGLTFVITGSLSEFENRDALKNYIEARGGKTTSSVTSKSSYLINNDSHSTSTKNTQAQKLNIPIITETDFLSMFGEAIK